MTRKTGTQFERLVRLLFGSVATAELGREVEVVRNVVLQGRTGTHEIDVFWRVQVGNIFYDVVVQAKDWARAVDQGEVLKFKAVLDDLPNRPRGIMVSTGGFQRGARKIAGGHGILLFKVFRRPKTCHPKLEVTTTSITKLSIVGAPAVVGGAELRDAAKGSELFIRHDIWFAEDIDIHLRTYPLPPDSDVAAAKLAFERLGYSGLWLMAREGEKERLSSVIQGFIRDANRTDAEAWTGSREFKPPAHIESVSGDIVVSGVQVLEVEFRVRHVVGHHPLSAGDKDNYIIEDLFSGAKTVVKVPTAMGEASSGRP